MIPGEVQWVIRYLDGTEFSNLDGEPWDAPRTNVMAVLQRGDPLVDIAVHRSSPGLWVWKYSQWVALMSDWAIWDYLGEHFDDRLVVLRGNMLPRPMWDNYKHMFEDTNRMFGTPKTSYRSARTGEFPEDDLVASHEQDD